MKRVCEILNEKPKETGLVCECGSTIFSPLFVNDKLFAKCESCKRQFDLEKIADQVILINCQCGEFVLTKDQIETTYYKEPKRSGDFSDYFLSIEQMLKEYKEMHGVYCPKCNKYIEVEKENCQNE